MRLCRTCGHLSAKNPTFCPRCGGSFDARICPRGHRSGRFASACAECGSRELSQAQPSRRWLATGGFVILRVVIGAALLVGSAVYALSFLQALVHNPSDLLGRMLVGLGLAIAWLLFVSLA